MATPFETSAAPGVIRVNSKVCEHCQPLRHETNILVLARLNVLQRLSDINVGLALASIVYFAVSLVLLLVSAWPGDHLVDGGVFHTLDFGSNFWFSLTEALTLLYSPERKFSAPMLLRVLIFCSVCSTFVGFLLIQLNRTVFEVVAHNIDYLNDFTVALVDSLLVSTVVRSPASHPGRALPPRGKPCESYGKQIALLATFVPVTLSFLQVTVYNGLGVDLRGHLLGERPAHVLEFIFDAFGAAINFWFCLDSRMVAEDLTRQIMIAPDELVVVIDPESKTSVHAADECGRSPYFRSSAPPSWQVGNGHSHVHDHGHDHSQCFEHDHGHLGGTQQNRSALTEYLLPNDMSSVAKPM